MTDKRFAPFEPAQRPMPRDVAIVGAGPAGLIAAEVLATAGHRVTIYDRMPSPARKFLMAGRGGLNLTHSEVFDRFQARYSGSCAAVVRSAVGAFPPSMLIDWANGLDAATFVGSSGRVFPKAMKASPLLRAWLQRLNELGVIFKSRHMWTGLGADGALLFTGPDGAPLAVRPDAAILAVGGASWPKLGSDGSWVTPLGKLGVDIAPLQPSNCGITIPWSPYMAKLEGMPLKNIAITCGSATSRGEAVVTRKGLEGGAIYALSADIREQLATGTATLTFDLRADWTRQRLTDRLIDALITKASTTGILRKAAGLSPAAAAIVHEASPVPRDPEALAALIKAVPLTVSGLAGMERAISTAGGVSSAAIDGRLMLTACPGIFVAGEMLDVDAPTGGYLLQEAFATGVAAARGAKSWLAERPQG